ncbi:PspC domain-containing protein [Streptomyces sp. AV19]|uniref:PspC domain-containing protein n=1 Tax=Streptomyces sp. AV19 TaxID=2793068 RepID=UPI0018FE3C43|nr:PspC domain-containing protein [Streptomyces sp. AV19]MBH1935982.1 PspC domain-containing protein [Streptomyces sp. AV19]MDG4534227.1 PspC domain-containing protein [Streptomyces sp. AV19]
MTDAPPSPGPGAPLRRSRDHKMISGVCGGLGRFFDLDPVIFRVVLGVLAVSGGLGLIVYGFAWLLIPLEGEEENEGRRMLSGRVEGPALTAVLCALVGSGLFLSMLNNSGAMAFSLMLTLALIGTAHWSRLRRGTPETAAEPPAAQKAQKPQKAMDAPPETRAPPPPGAPSWWRDPVAAGRRDPGYLWGPDDGPHDAGVVAKERRRRVRDGRQLGGWTFLLAAAACALGIALSWHGRPLGTSLQIGLGCALAVFGAGIALSSRYGRTGGGTVTMAVLTGLLLAGAAALPESVTADWRSVTWRPAATDGLRPQYRVGSGTGTLDLTGLPRSGSGRLTTSVEVGAGRLEVVLPPDVTAEVTAEVGVGAVRLPDGNPRDVDVKPRQTRRATLRPAPGQPSRATLELRLKTGIGEVEVTRAAA